MSYPPPPQYFGESFVPNAPPNPASNTIYPATGQNVYRPQDNLGFVKQYGRADGSLAGQNPQVVVGGPNGPSRSSMMPMISNGPFQAPYGAYGVTEQHMLNTDPFRPSIPVSTSNSYSSVPNPNIAHTNLHVPPPLGIKANLPEPLQSSLDMKNVDFGPVDMLDSRAPELEDGEVSSGDSNNTLDDIYSNPPHYRHERADTRSEALRRPSPQVQAREVAMSDYESGEELESGNSFVSNDMREDVEYPVIAKADGPPLTILESARSILEDLQTYGIGFQEMLHEGFDVKVLRFLHSQVGIPTGIGSAAHKPLAVTQTPKLKQILSNVPDPVDRNHQYQTSDRTQKVMQRTTDDSPKTDASPKPVGALLVSSSTDFHESPVVDKPTKSSAQMTPPSLRELKKTPETKAIDRKEYIARMLAAKAGKSAVRSANLPVHVISSTDPPKPETDAPLKVIKDDASLTTENPKPVQTSNIDQSAVEASDLEAKRRAQTELARQRIEALKTQAKPQLNIQSTFTPLQSVTNTVTNETTATVQMSQQTPNSAEPPPRAASYFSPVSIQPAFSLPGLFSSADAKPVEERIIPVEAAQQSSIGSTNSSPKGYETFPDNKIDEDGSSNNNDLATEKITRKRKIAADFIDSPATKLRKSFSQSEDNSVVIDISEDSENEDASEYQEAENSSSSNQRFRQFEQAGSFQRPDLQRKLGFYPSLSDTSPRLPSVHNSSTAVPSNHRNNAKAQEPEYLKSKQVEIEQMNRRIAELEQRVKSKRTPNRGQSPTQSLSSVNVRDGSASAAYFKVAEGVDVEERSSEFPSNRPASPKGTLVPEMGSTEMEKPVSLDEKQLMDQSTPMEIVDDGHHANKEDASQTGRVETSVNSPPSDYQYDPPDEFNTGSTQVELELSAQIFKLDKEITEAEAKVETHEIEIRQIQDRLVKSKTYKKQLLENLDKLSIRLQKVEQDESCPPTPIGATTTDNGVEAVGKQAAEQSEIYEDLIKGSGTESGELSSDRRLQEMPEIQQRPVWTSTEAAEDAQPFDEKATDPETADTNSTHQLSEGELEDDGMDISRSDLDGGELESEGLQNVENKNSSSFGVDDDEEVYEPPSEIILQQSAVSEPSLSSINATEEQLSGPFLASEDPLGKLLGTQDDNTVTIHDEIVLAVPALDKDTPRSRTSISSGWNGSDDYEPPDVGDAAIALHDTLESHKQSTQPTGNEEMPQTENSIAPSPPEVSNMAVTAETENMANEGRQRVTQVANKYFTPYNSPLKQLKAYRFHPDFLQSTPGGFRSLTYSNSIRSELPVCQYEVGGICNDEACPDQHFRQMRLSDDLILSDMGSAEGSTPEDRNAYIAGLRDVIIDLRSRKVKDLDSIGSKISDYRAQYLGNASSIVRM